MTRAVLSIGANVGDSVAALRSAADAFRPWLTAASSIYRTPPWGGVEQADFANAVLIVEDEAASPTDWLARAQAAEQAAGRVRDIRWGPRVLDVDVITVDDLCSDDPALTLPHPRAHQRAFVLVPWLEVEPTAQLSARPLPAWLEQLPAADVAAVRPIAAADVLLDQVPQ